MKSLSLLISLFILSTLTAQVSFQKNQHNNKKRSTFSIYSPDGELFVTASGKFLNIYYRGNDEPVRNIESNFYNVKEIFYKNDSVIIVSGYNIAGNIVPKLQYFNVKTGVTLQEHNIPHLKKGDIRTVIPLKKDNRFAFIYEKEIVVYENDSIIYNTTGGWIEDLEYNRKNDLLYAINSQGFLKIHDLNKKTIVDSLYISNKRLFEVEVSKKGDLIAIAGRKNKLFLIEKKNDRLKEINLNSRKLRKRYHGLKFSMDGSYLASINEQNFQIWSVKTKSLVENKKVKHAPVPTSICFDPMGRIFNVTSFNSRKVQLWSSLALNIKPYFEILDETDKIAPQIIISNPKVINDVVTVFSNSIDLKGLAIDNAGISAITVNGNKTNLSASGDFEVKINLAIGRNRISVEAKDINNNIAKKTFSIIRKEFDINSFNLESKNFVYSISIDDYKNWNPLSNAVSDADSLLSVLETKYDFQSENMIRLKNEEATKQGVINGFKDLISKVGPNDNLIIYYSGHGFFDADLGEGYWIPVDAAQGSDADYIPNSFLMQLIKKVDAKHVFLVADACFSGSLFADNTRGYVENVGNIKSRWGLASGRLEFVSDGEQGKQSPFNKYLVKYLLDNKKEKFPVSDLIQYVKINVANESNQSPLGNSLKGLGDEGGEFIFKLK